MEQTIQINPVELATQLAASRIDELYQSNEIPFPYVDDNEDTDVTCYTEEGQKHFDNWYDWYYTVVTGHKIVYSMPNVKKEKPEYKFLTENYDFYSEGVHKIEYILGDDYDEGKIIELYEFEDEYNNNYCIWQYEDRYILIGDREDYYGNLHNEYHEIKLINL
jgi:hypothetical protein